MSGGGLLVRLNEGADLRQERRHVLTGRFHEDDAVIGAHLLPRKSKPSSMGVMTVFSGRVPAPFPQDVFDQRLYLMFQEVSRRPVTQKSSA
jgi:hypothetical protein